MIEVVRSRLDARERHRWSVALAARPILAERAPSPARGPQLVAMASGLIYLAMLVVVLAESTFALRGGAVGAVAMAGGALALRTAQWMWRERRATWPSGRFVFRWGYVEAEHDHLRVVASSELQPVALPETEGVAEIALRQSDGTPLHTFRVGADDDLDLAALEDLGTPAPPLVLEGYRELARPRGAQAPARRRLSPRARDVAWIALAATLGFVGGPSVQAHLEASHVRPLRALEEAWRRDTPAPWDAAPTRVAPVPRD
ncbi:MAG: hypothetical protein U0234_04440 [Sandaracinus sp.]